MKKGNRTPKPNRLIDSHGTPATMGDDGCTEFVVEGVAAECDEADAVDEGFHLSSHVAEVVG